MPSNLALCRPLRHLPGCKLPGTTSTAPPTISGWVAMTSSSSAPPSDTPICSGGRPVGAAPLLLLPAPVPLDASRGAASSVAAAALLGAPAGPRAASTSAAQWPWPCAEGSRFTGSLRLPAAPGECSRRGAEGECSVQECEEECGSCMHAQTNSSQAHTPACGLQRGANAPANLRHTHTAVARRGR